MIYSFHPQRRNLPEISAYAIAFGVSLLLHGAALQLLSEKPVPPTRYPITIDATIEFMSGEGGGGSGGDGSIEGLTASSLAAADSTTVKDEIELLSGAAESVAEPVMSPPEPAPRPDKRTISEQLRQLQRSLLQQDLRYGAGSGGGNGPYIPGLRGSGSGIGNYIVMIAGKIQKNVNRDLCRRARPEIVFAISLRPDGQLQAPPRLLQSSGAAACDQAIERAILQSLPLPVPNDPAAFAALHELHLLFRPHDENFWSQNLE